VVATLSTVVAGLLSVIAAGGSAVAEFLAMPRLPQPLVLFLATLSLAAVGWWLWLSRPAKEATAIPASKTAAQPAPVAADSPSKLSSSGKYIGAGGMNERGQRMLESLSPGAAKAKLEHAATALAQTAPGVFRLGKIEINAKARTLTVPVSVQMQTGPLEYALVHESGKTHEALFVTSVPPQELHIAALLLSGMKQRPKVEVTWRRNGPAARYDLADLIEVAGEEKQLLAQGAWLYGGSQFIGAVFAAQAEGSMVALIEDGSALISATGSAGRHSDELFSPRADRLPPKGLSATMVFTFPQL
jgi:hypothetical protein